MAITEKPVDLWKQIQGFSHYQISYSGQVRRIYANGKIKILAQFKKSGIGKDIYRDRLFVKITNDNGKAINVMVHQIVAKHFLGIPKPNQVAYHINGCVMDNWVSNLAYIDRKKLGQLTGASSSRQPVVKIDSTGEVVECFTSARDAARKNFMSYQTVIDRCNNKCKKAFAPDGYEYAWDDKEVSMRQAIRRIELARIKADGKDHSVICRIADVKQKERGVSWA